MRIALLHEDFAVRGAATPDQLGVLETIDAVDVALVELGHSVVRIAVTEHVDEWSTRLQQADADVVFNLCETLCGRSDHEFRVAAVVELLGLPLTGNGAETLALG